MTTYFYDLEFHEDGHTIDLISVGMVADDGREYYAVNADANWERIRDHPWLMANVVPHLPAVIHARMNGRPSELRTAMHSHPVVKPHWLIAAEVSEFIRAGGDNRDDHELVAYYGAYDHVRLCQLWGRMVDLPQWVPMYTNDLKSMERGLEKVGFAPVPPPNEAEHNALVDARWNAAYWDAQVEATQRYLDSLAVPKGWVIIREPTAARLFERMTSEGPNEGISKAEEDDLREWWQTYTYPPGEPEAGDGGDDLPKVSDEQGKEDAPWGPDPDGGWLVGGEHRCSDVLPCDNPRVHG